MLETITNLHIDYFSYLCYSDIQNLCQVSHFYTNLCTDTLLKTIIFNKSGINISRDINVANLMKLLDDSINALFKCHYLYYPKWVIKNYFIMSKNDIFIMI